MTTIALLEGDALGGGFESALSCDVVIAEKHVKAGFPEVLFNMFPGMGGLSFLSRRVGRKVVQRAHADRAGSTRRRNCSNSASSTWSWKPAKASKPSIALMRLREQQLERARSDEFVDRLLRPVTLQRAHRRRPDCGSTARCRLPPRSLEWMRRLHQQQVAAFGGGARLELVPAPRQALAA